MSNYRRPWWLIVNRPAGLVTTVQEESRPGERVFIIRGEPMVQGLAWLTWGPVAALVAILLLAILAVAFEVREQAWMVRGLVVVAFLGLPALAWGGTTIAMSQLSEKYLQAERQADRQECVIRLNQKQGELFYRTTAHPQENRLAYDHIRQARLTYPIGGGRKQAMRLTLSTDEGPVVLLDEALGTRAQKADLAKEIQEALAGYGDAA